MDVSCLVDPFVLLYTQDPPRLRNFAAKRYNLNSMLISPKRDAPPEGTRGTFRSLGEDVGSCSSSTNGNQPSRSKPRPLSQEVGYINCLNFFFFCNLFYSCLVGLSFTGTPVVTVVIVRNVPARPTESSH